MSVLMLVSEHLCINDPRSNGYWEREEPLEPRGGCVCERCWSGRDTLAVALQEAADLLEVADDQVRSMPLGGDATARAAFALLARLKKWRADYEPVPTRPPA